MGAGEDRRMADQSRTERLVHICAIAGVILGFYLTSLHSYLLFHSLIEVTTVAIGFTLFILTWNTRHFLNNDFLKVLGIGYSFIAVIDLLHTLAFQGLNIFPGYGNDLTVQLWIAARYVQAISILLAITFMKLRLDNRAILGGYAVTVSILVFVIFHGHFPVCFIDGKGLTPFKIHSEYVIATMLLASLLLLYRNRNFFHRGGLFLVMLSVTCTVLSELSFTEFVSMYDFSNMVGHFFKLAAFYLIYRAILVTGFKEPFDLIFWDLKQKEDALLKAHEDLEDTVLERTRELRESEENYRSLIQKVQTGIVLHDGQGRILNSNRMAQKLLGLSADQILGKDLVDSEWHFLREDNSILPVTEYPASQVRSTRQPLKGQVMGIYHAERNEVTWTLVNAEPEYNAAQQITRILVSFVDITDRKMADALLNGQKRVLELIAMDVPLLESLTALVYLMEEYAPGMLGSILLLDEEGIHLHHGAAPSLPQEYTAAIDGVNIGPSVGSCGTAAYEKKPIYVADIASDPLWNDYKLVALAHGLRACWSTPIFDAQNKVLGTFAIYYRNPGLPQPFHHKLIDIATHTAAIAIGNHCMRTALIESERKFRAIFDHTFQFIGLLRANGTMIDVNQSALNLIRIKQSEVIGKPFWETPWWTHSTEMQDKLRDAIQQAAVGTFMRFEATFLTADGSLRNVDFSLKPIIDDNGTVTLIIPEGRDITERKQMEARLQQAREFTEQIINAIPDPLFVKDRQHRFYLLNSMFCSFTGHKYEDLIGKSDYDFFPKEEAEEFRSRDELVFQSEQPNLNEEALTDSAGNRYSIQTRKASFVAADGREFLIGVIRDITERKCAEETLLKLNRKLRAISNCNGALIWAVDESSLLSEVCRIICDEAGYRMAWVGFVDHNPKKTLRPVAWAGCDSDYIARIKLTWADDSEFGQGPAESAIRSGKIIHVQDSTTDPHMARWRESAVQHGYKSCLALPLMDENANIFGVLPINSAEIDAFSSEEREILEELAGDLAFGITTLRTRAALQKSEEQMRLEVNRMPIAYIVWDMDFRVVTWNPAAETIFGFTFDEVKGLHPYETIVSLEAQPIIDEIWGRLLAGDSTAHSVNENITKDGTVIVCEWTNTPLKQPDGVVLGVMSMVQDITARKQAEDELRKLNQELETRVKERTAQLEIANKELEVLSYRDGLTNIFNRRHFDQQLDQEWRRCSRHKISLSLIMVDIDYFKNYNDSCGHLQGDECLKFVALCIANHARRVEDLAARYGGEEFVLLLPDTDILVACTIAEALRSAVESLNLPHGASLVADHVTISLGVSSIIPVYPGNPQELIRSTDLALYGAKSSGRNRVVLNRKEEDHAE